MRILYQTSSTHIGGSERFLLRLAQGIRKLRRDWHLDCIVLGPHGPLHEEYRETFSALYDEPQTQAQAPMALVSIVTAGRYDVCHCTDCFSVTLPAARLCEQTRFVQNVFPAIGRSEFSPRLDWLADTDLPYSTLVTEFQANAARLPRLPHGKVLTIPNGIDTDFWTPAPMERIDATWKVRPDGTIDNTVYQNGKMVAPTRDIDVIWVGHLGRNGYDTALRLVPLLCGAGLRYMIVTSEGDGPHSELRALAMKHPTLRFRWKEQPEKLRGYFRRSKIFLSTSQVEGMPATPLEAAACGCRPLVPCIDGLAEAFRDWEPFFQCSWWTKEVLCGYISRIVTMDIEEHQREARKIACRYSLENMVNNYLELYTSLVAKEN